MNINLMKCRGAACFLFVSLFLLFSFSTTAYAQESDEAVIYCFIKSSRSELLSSYFNNSDWQVVYLNLNVSTFLERFLNVTNTLQVLGVEVVPPDLCKPCELQHHTWDEILISYGSPLIGFFHEGKLAGLTVGIADHDTLNQALTVNNENITVFTPYNVYSITDVNNQLQESVRVQRNVSDFVMPITLLAITDSMNPYTFALFTAMLFITPHSISRKRWALTGFYFILAIFFGYYIMRLGSFSIQVTITYIDRVFAFFGLTLGVFNVCRGLKVGYESSIPESLHSLFKMRIIKTYSSIFVSLLGLVTTFVLLLSSGEPFVDGLELLSTLRNPIQIHLLLFLYNLILLMPLVLILTFVLALSSWVHKIKVFKRTKFSYNKVSGGVLLIIVCLYLLVS